MLGNKSALCVILLFIIVLASCGQRRAISEKNEGLLRTELERVKRFDNPLETKKPSREYIGQLLDATKSIAKTSEAIEPRTELEQEAQRALHRLMYTVGPMSAKVIAFDEYGDVVPADTEAGRKIGEQGRIEPERDEEGRKVYRRETVMRREWEELQARINDLEYLIGLAGSEAR